MTTPVMTPVMINSAWHTEMLGDLVVAGLRACEKIIFSPNGARCASPGQRPGNKRDDNLQP